MTSRRFEKKKKLFLEFFEKNLGIVSPSVKAAGIGRSTYYQWRKCDKEFDERCREIEERQGDAVETELLKLIKEGNAAAIIFYCKTKLRGRGYNEERESSRINVFFDGK